MFLAIAIAALAAISSGRVVTASNHQAVLEDESRAYNNAFGRIHMAMSAVNSSAYDDDNQNLVIRTSLADPVVAADDEPEWLADPEGVQHGLIEGTDVRVYHARDYIQRLQKLKGESPEPVDPFGDSEGYFVLEAQGRAGDTVCLISALVRETEPFSSFVFFQNQHTLGISGAPRGLIHGNTNIAFYFPNGRYTDSVSSVGGFEFRAGATPENTMLRNGNPNAASIDLDAVDFDKLRREANLYEGAPGLDAELKLFGDGKVRITPYTPPRYDLVTVEEYENKLIRYDTVTRTEIQPVQVGTTTEERSREVVVGSTTETYTVEVPIYETREVTRSRQVPVYETQTVTRTRWVKVFVPYDTGDGDGAGGTTVGDSGDGILGEYVWVEEEYQVEEQVLVGYTTETYTETEQVQVGSSTEERTREVPVYETETYTVEVPVYEDQEVTITEEVPVYKEFTKSVQKWQYQPPVPQADEHVWLNDYNGTVYVDGRVTSIGGDLNGRLTVVANEKVRITDDIRYVDDGGHTAMRNGDSSTLAYERNPEYEGDSVLGIIARDDILFTWTMPDRAEINATLMSVEGRIGADALWVEADGDVHPDSAWARRQVLTAEEREIEANYDRGGTYRTRRFVKESLRRLGGIISNERIVETYIRARNDGTAYVDAGFKRGAMRYDFNLRFNPPPNFVELPRPVVTSFTPVFFVRNND